LSYSSRSWRNATGFQPSSSLLPVSSLLQQCGKEKKEFQRKNACFFFGRFFQEERLLFNDREEQSRQKKKEPIFCRTKKSCSFCLGGDEPPLRTRKMQKEEFTTRTTRGQRENIY
jgi:hypothetical protein